MSELLPICPICTGKTSLLQSNNLQIIYCRECMLYTSGHNGFEELATKWGILNAIQSRCADRCVDGDDRSGVCACEPSVASKPVSRKKNDQVHAGKAGSGKRTVPVRRSRKGGKP